MNLDAAVTTSGILAALTIHHPYNQCENSFRILGQHYICTYPLDVVQGEHTKQPTTNHSLSSSHPLPKQERMQWKDSHHQAAV